MDGSLAGKTMKSGRDNAGCSWQVFQMKSSIYLYLCSALLACNLVKAADTNSPASGPDLTAPSKLNEKAPDTFKTRFDTTKGSFTIEVTRSLSPNGADRFYNLVKNGYFKDIAFFRVVPGFMVQFGIHGDPKVAAAWSEANIQDDEVKTSNTRGMLTFAKTSMPNSRSTQLFINFGNNAFLDGQGFSPFGKVTDGMDVVDKINSESGERPNQMLIQKQGNVYLKKEFPNLDYIKSATIVH
jgi:peptidyl-prolyl cis-trans isomerase A (cyclophilin A)